MSGDSRAGMDCDPSRLTVGDFALAGVQSCAYLETEIAQRADYGIGTANGACRAVEGCEEAVAGGVDLSAAEAKQFAPDQLVVALEQFPPTAVAQFGCPRRRSDDVGEEDGGENPVGFALLPTAGVPDTREEGVNLIGDLPAAGPRVRWPAPGTATNRADGM